LSPLPAATGGESVLAPAAGFIEPPCRGTPGNSPIPAAHAHDGFFKAVFSQPEHATAFFKSHLPPEVVSRIDWPSLVLLPGSFIKEGRNPSAQPMKSHCKAASSTSVAGHGHGGRIPPLLGGIYFR
jgi:hypothetical protein